MKKGKFILLLILGWCGAIVAQDKASQLSLEQAIKQGLENNRLAKNATLDIEAAKAQKWETTAIGLPQIDGKVAYQDFLKQQVSLVPAEFFGGTAGEFAEVAFGTKKNINATATASQLLFDGSYLVGLQSAKVFLEISKNAKQKTDIEVRKQIIASYGNVLLVEESLLILEKNKAAIEKNLYESEKLLENGLIEEESVEQLQITLSQIENNRNKTEKLRRVSYQALNFLLGNDIKTPLKLSDSLEALALKATDRNMVTETFQIEENIDYKISKNQERSNELLLKLEKSKALPQLTAFINGGYTGNSNTFSFFERQQDWFGSSLFGVNLNIPLFSSGKRAAATKRAKINLEIAQNELEDTKNKLELELERERANFEFAIDQLESNQKNLALAERIENKNQIKFKEGVAGSFDLRQAQLQLYSAQQEYLQAMVDLINSKANFEAILKSK